MRLWEDDGWPLDPSYDESLFPSERVLKSDTFDRSACGLVIAGVLMCLWLAWFWRARVTVYAISDTADVEVDRAAHPIESQYTGQVVTSTLALDREVEAGEALVELDADVSIHGRSKMESQSRYI